MITILLHKETKWIIEAGSRRMYILYNQATLGLTFATNELEDYRADCFSITEAVEDYIILSYYY